MNVQVSMHMNMYGNECTNINVYKYVKCKTLHNKAPAMAYVLPWFLHRSYATVCILAEHIFVNYVNYTFCVYYANYVKYTIFVNYVRSSVLFICHEMYFTAAQNIQMALVGVNYNC